MQTLQSLGTRLAQKIREKAAREHRDITQMDVAQAAGVSKGAISRYVSDVDVPRDPVLEKIATFLDTTAAFLRYGVSEPTSATGAQHVAASAAPPPRPVKIQRIKSEVRTVPIDAHKKAAPGKGGQAKGKRTGS